MNFRLSSTTTLILLLASSLLVGARTIRAASATATINLINATGISSPLGMVSFVDSPDGLVITPKLSGLPPGEHGFHIHDKGDCGPGMNEGKAAAGSDLICSHVPKKSWYRTGGRQIASIEFLRTQP